MNASGVADVVAWRRDFHRHPELLYEVDRTAGKVADLLRGFGVDEVATGIGVAGVVGVIRGTMPGRTIALRADMDALPIEEETGKAYRSSVPGRMHACGHDGHTAMLLGAARDLAATRRFRGTAVVVFQPAEEGGAGGKAMVDDGLMERFGIEEIYGLHNMPGLPVGEFATRPGSLMAATDNFMICVRGQGGHAARPHDTVDPILAGTAIVQGLMTIVSRAVDPLAAAVVSVTRFHAGGATNVISETAEIAGTVRTLDPSVRAAIQTRVEAIADRSAAAFGATCRVEWTSLNPVTANHPEQAAFAVGVAREIASPAGVNAEIDPVMIGEDFSFMLAARPGAFVFIGNGDSAGLHSPAYDFNDEVIPFGCALLTQLVEKRS